VDERVLQGERIEPAGRADIGLPQSGGPVGMLV
jgi:hypothetical protein